MIPDYRRFVENPPNPPLVFSTPLNNTFTVLPSCVLQQASILHLPPSFLVPLSRILSIFSNLNHDTLN
jgi:hypothetical protein